MSKHKLIAPATLTLLRRSLPVWQVEGQVEVSSAHPGCFEIRPADAVGWVEVEAFTVRTETGGLLPRWLIRPRQSNDTGSAKLSPPEQTVHSVRGLLREVRRLLDPEYVPYRAVIGFDPTRTERSRRPPPSSKGQQS